MKRVHSAQMVAHLWANKAQDDARTAGANFFFTGPTLYSYGAHFVIAHHLDNGGILWNDARYSNTTARQQSHAWRALAGWQRGDTLYRVPSLDDSDVRDLTRKAREKTGAMPTVAQACADAVISRVADMAGKKHGAGPLAGLHHEALSFERAGKMLCALVSGRKKCRWPLPDLPASADDVPADKAARAAFIKQYAAAKLRDESAAHYASAVQLHDHAVTAARESAGRYNMENIVNGITGAMRECRLAAEKHFNATGKQSAKIAKLQKAIAADEPAIRAAYDEYKVKEARHIVADAAARAWRGFREQKQARRQGKPVRPQWRNRHHYRLEEAVARLDGELGEYAGIIARAGRADAWREAGESFERAQGAIESAQSYMPQWPADALREYRRALAYLADAAQCGAFAQYRADAIESMRAACDAAIPAIDAELKAKEATRTADWLSGASNVRPAHGTYARIKGDIVETSRGATVPLAHACRLARIARRVIAQGGRVWPHGAGPMVGSFRVNSIGADGAAVIGCHEFDAAEVARMLALLESCDTCKAIADDAVIAA